MAGMTPEMMSMKGGDLWSMAPAAAKPKKKWATVKARVCRIWGGAGGAGGGSAVYM